MTLVLRSPLLLRHGFVHGFSLRTGGASAAPYDSLNLGRSVGDDPARVAENHLRMAQAVGYAPERLYELSQVHGRYVRQVHGAASPLELRREEGDGLVSADGSLAVGVRAADCLPLLLADPETRCVAAVHAGWRGTVAGVAFAGVKAVCELAGAPASRLVAAVFPHIRACCFEVGPEVASELVRVSHGAQPIVCAEPKPRVDLAAVVRAQLMTMGLPASAIDDVPGCTRCEPARFFSYRRDGKASGRHLAAIVAG